MPTITVDKVPFFKALGKDYTTEEFDELCFEYGRSAPNLPRASY